MFEKQKFKIAAVVFVIILMGLSYNIFITRSIPVLKYLSQGKTVVIDPGHGSVDKGAVHEETGVAESPINLQVALKLKELLENESIKVVLTRDKDTVELDTNRKELQRRIDLAAKSKADMFVSIHANKFPDPLYFGAQCFYNPLKPESKLLALLIQEELKKIDAENIREALPQDLFILRESPMPSVLIEIGFLSNPKDRERLQDPTFQNMIAESIKKGIVRYFSGDSPVKNPEYS